MSPHQAGGVGGQAKAKSGQMRTGGVGVVSQMWWTGLDRGGLKDPQICADILYGWPLILKIPKPPNNFEMESVHNYKKYNLKEKLILLIFKDKVFRILKNFDETKASDINDFSKKLD